MFTWCKIFAFSGKKIVMKEKISFQQLRPFLTFPLFRSGPPSVSRVCKGNVFLFLNEIFFPKFYMAFVLKIENSFYPWREDHLLWSSSLGGTFTCSSSSFHLSERCKTFQIITGKFVKIWQLHYVMYILCLV